MEIWIAPKRTIGRRQFFRRYEAAINYSILASAKANQVEPFAYVRSCQDIPRPRLRCYSLTFG